MKKFTNIKYLLIGVSAAALFTSAAPVGARSSETVEEYLRAFHANPARMMQRLPSYVDKDGRAYPRGYIRSDDPDWEEIIKFRSQVRDKVLAPALDVPDPNLPPIPTPPKNPDSPDRIVEPGVIVTNISAMQSANITQAIVEPAPWTDSYWPAFRGLTSLRYTDQNIPKTKNWIDFYTYQAARPTASIIASGDPAQIDGLSPAEKYDFVMGDMNFSLTNYGWGIGASYNQRGLNVPEWVGICHGWAAAAHMNAAYPQSPVTVRAPNGIPVTFYPQDVKALQSLLWANSSPRTRFAGNRCSISNPAKNPNGRIIDPKCFDVSPSTWHIAIANQLALHKRSFIMDATYDLEVWNFPVVGYRYRYFNPQTWQETSSLGAAVISMDSFKVDKFPEFRSLNARYIVGVYMDVTYVIESVPNRRPVNVPPPTKTVRYIYDLELDGLWNIIGGEWYSNIHPDFLWTFDQKAQAKPREDKELVNIPWDMNGPVPPAWAATAAKASSRGVPLRSFLDKIAPPPPPRP